MNVDVCGLIVTRDRFGVAAVRHETQFARADLLCRCGVAEHDVAESRAEREALSLIHFLRDQGTAKDEWLDAITADQTISEPVRERALQVAREWK